MIVFLSLYLFASGCCLIPTEVYEDSPSQAWHLSLLQEHFADLEVEQGIYWSSSHWSHEYSYCFQFAPNPSAVQDMIEGLDLTENPTFNIEQLRSDNLYAFPIWFAPKGGTYRVWTKDPFVLIIEGNTQEIYLHATQL